MSVPVAIKTKRVKHALLALTRPGDTYLTAWVSWSTHGARNTSISPHQSSVKHIVSPSFERYPDVIHELGCTLQPDIAQTAVILARVQKHLPNLRSSSTSWWEENDWILHLSEPLPWRPQGDEIWPQEINDFWQTFQWSGNPWILSPQALELSRSKYNRIRDVSLEQLHIQRTGPQEYVFSGIGTDVHDPRHSHAKLREWAIIILLSSPPLDVGNPVGCPSPLRLRQQLPFTQAISWVLIGPGKVRGVSLSDESDRPQSWELTQCHDGITWVFDGAPPLVKGKSQELTQKAESKLSRHGVVFFSNPQIHHYPWSAPPTVPNHRLFTFLKKQAFQATKRGLAAPLKQVIDRLATKSQNTRWQCTALNVTPAQLWDHGHAVTEYQLWTRYRHATGQLNFYYQNRPPDGSCTYLECVGQKETQEHLFWGCPRAQAIWARLISHWESTPHHPTHLLDWLEHCANCSVPRISPQVTAKLLARYPEDIDLFATAWRTIWEVAVTVIITMLWQLRVDRIFNNALIPIQASETLIWNRIQLQLRALIKRLHCRAATAVRGAQLSACYDIFISEPRGQSGVHRRAASRRQFLDPPALLVWLTTYQRSCTNQ